MLVGILHLCKSRQSGAHIGFAYEDVNGHKVTETLKDVFAKQAVEKLTAKFPLQCTVNSNGIMATKAKTSQTATAAQKDDKANPKKSVLTDDEGVFRLPMAKGAKATLEFSFVGMETQTVSVANNQPAQAPARGDEGQLDRDGERCGDGYLQAKQGGIYRFGQPHERR